MSQLVTRCPHCSTSFHVNEQQLRAARGAVRCGSCLQVFRADENIVFNEGEAQAAAGKPLDALLDDDDFLIHDDIDLDGDEEEIRPPGKAQPSRAKIPAEKKVRPLIDDAFGEEQWQDLNAPASDDDGEDNGEIETWAEEPEDGDDPWGNEQPEPPRKREAARIPDWKELPDDDFAEHFERIGGGKQQPARRAGARAGKPAPKPAPHSAEQSFYVAPERERLISAIEPAPLEVSWRPQRDRRLPGWAWTLLALLLALGLAAQVGYYHFDSLSKREPWRAIYAQLCPHFGCRLPELVDLRAIHTSNLVVRSHPQLEGALVVDAVLLNTAPFAQPFPNLLLSFTDLKNNPVASRRFSPRDYLQGELAGRKQMPAGNPVHIAIEIVDPGSAAVNYELHIAP